MFSLLQHRPRGVCFHCDLLWGSAVTWLWRGPVVMLLCGGLHVCIPMAATCQWSQNGSCQRSWNGSFRLSPLPLRESQVFEQPPANLLFHPTLLSKVNKQQVLKSADYLSLSLFALSLFWKPMLLICTIPSSSQFVCSLATQGKQKHISLCHQMELLYP